MKRINASGHNLGPIYTLGSPLADHLWRAGTKYFMKSFLGNPTPPAFVRFRTTADNGRFWPAMVCPLRPIADSAAFMQAARWIAPKDNCFLAAISVMQRA